MKKMNWILGTITFGQQTLDSDAAKMVKTAMDNGVFEIDTAYVYNEGESEKILGRLFADMKRSSFRVATKANPRITGKLDKAAIVSQFTESLERLGLEYADVLYLHYPDSIVPLEEAFSTCNELYTMGKVREIGLSNYPAELVGKAFELCKKNGWVTPSVYEGLYNVLSRNAEGELFETLRRYGIRFTAYNPLAGGLLTGKYSSFEALPDDGRFVKRASYKNRYWKKSFFDAVDYLRPVCENAGIPIAEVALRWMAYHSSMDSSKGDAIIIGASNPAQLVQNINAMNKGELPKEVVVAIEKAWTFCREDAPPYFKFIN